MKIVPLVDTYMFLRMKAKYDFFTNYEKTEEDWFYVEPDLPEYRQFLTLILSVPEEYLPKFSSKWILEEPKGTDMSSADGWGEEKVRCLQMMMDVCKANSMRLPYKDEPEAEPRYVELSKIDLIPNISCDGDNGDLTGGFNPVDIFKYEINEKYAPYVNFISENIEEFNRVLIGWWGTESGAYDRWILKDRYPKVYKKMESDDHYSINKMIAELERMKELFPVVFSAEKACIMASDIPFESEARIYEGRLQDAPLLNWCKENNVTVILCRGFWTLESSKTIHTQIEGNASPVMMHAPLGPYPYTYFKEYINEHEFWSGLGRIEGALKGYADKLIEFGFKEVYTYFPNAAIEPGKFPVILS
jgi:hypothetical protein